MNLNTEDNTVELLSDGPTTVKKTNVHERIQDEENKNISIETNASIVTGDCIQIPINRKTPSTIEGEASSIKIFIFDAK